MIACPGCNRKYTLSDLGWGARRLESQELNKTVTCLDCSTVFHVTPIYKTTRIRPESPSIWRIWQYRLHKLYKRGVSSHS